MNRRNSTRTIKLLMILALVYIAVGVIFYFMQDRLIFHPSPLPAGHQFRIDSPFEEVNVVQADYNVSFVKFPAKGPRKGIVLYFHGNMNNLERYAPMAPLFTSRGYEVWMIDYPGFGKTTGKMSETRLYEDALLMYAYAAKEGEEITIYGRSIGSGVAAYLASVRPSRQLMLETPYYNLTELARSYAPLYPVRMLLKYKLPVNEYLMKVNAPIVIFHGKKDELIPYKQALKLSQVKPGIQLITIAEGKHNDLVNHPVFTNALHRALGN